MDGAGVVDVGVVDVDARWLGTAGEVIVVNGDGRRV
jgi:hypothetical protein